MKRVIVLFFFLHCLCATVKTFLGDADQEKNYVEMYSWEEIRLDCIDTNQRRKEKSIARRGEIAAKYFQMKRLRVRKFLIEE